MSDSILYRVTCTHYAPKDSHEAIQCVIRAPSEDAVFAYLNALTYGLWDDDEDAKDVEWSPADPLTDEETARATALGLEIVIEEWGTTLTGRLPAMVRFRRGDDFREVEDAYYGCTQYRWEAIPAEAEDDVLRAVLGDRFVCVDAADRAANPK